MEPQQWENVQLQMASVVHHHFQKENVWLQVMSVLPHNMLDKGRSRKTDKVE
jgi:hypothetical protein